MTSPTSSSRFCISNAQGGIWQQDRLCCRGRDAARNAWLLLMCADRCRRSCWLRICCAVWVGLLQDAVGLMRFTFACTCCAGWCRNGGALLDRHVQPRVAALLQLELIR